jgi:hypothetical protein
MIRKPDVNQFTGSVPVDGDVTPVTRQPIDHINAEDWTKMNVSDLHKQREILRARYYQALSVGIPAQTIEQGIRTIDAILESMGSDPGGFV